MNDIDEYQELRDWIDWEGGYDGLLQHGVDVDEDIPEAVRPLWREMEAAWRLFEIAKDKVNALVGY